MADAIGNDNDGLLLLELGIESDENEFDKARKQLDDLKGSLDNLDMNLDLGSLLSTLRTAGSLLKGIVDTWNSLENKALEVSFSTNDYLPYNLTPGLRQNIENRLAESKVAEHFGVTSDNVLNSLDSIINTQAKVMKQGKLNDTDATSLQQLGDLLNLPALQGGNLAGFFTDNTTSYVYETITGALADAYRLAYSKPEGSKERENILQYIKNVEDTPFVSPEVSHYISFMTEPNSPDYAKSGNPVYRFFSSGIEDESSYMDRLTKASAQAASNSEDFSVIKAEAKENFNHLITTLFNSVARQIVIPRAQDLEGVAEILSGKRMIANGLLGNYELEAFEHGKLTQGVRGKTQSAQTLTFVPISDLGSLTKHFGLSSNWVENTDLAKRANTILSNLKEGDALSTELTFYELMRLSSNYETTAKDATAYAIENVAKYHQKDAEFKGVKNTTQLYSKIAQEMADPKSKYYIGAEGGVASLYAMMYETGSFSDKDSKNTQRFLDTMGEVFLNTKMKEIGRYLGVEGTTDITKAEVVNEGTKKEPEFKLKVTIEDKKNNTTREEVYTAEELIAGIKASY